MAQQNVPTPAFTESPIEIQDIRSAFKAMVCDDSQEVYFFLKAMVCGDSQDVDFWLKAVDSLDDEEILKCDKIFRSFKKLIGVVLGLNKKQAYDDEKAVRASNIIENYNIIFARIAVKSYLKK